MRKLALLLVIAIGLSGTASFAQLCDLNEQGSLLVFPLIDNIAANRTIVSLVNRDTSDVWLEGFMIVSPAAAPETVVKKDLQIHLTPKEPFYWDTSKALNMINVDGEFNQVQPFNDYRGFLFLWAIDGKLTRLEKDHDYLLGDAVVLMPPAQAFQYNAIPHQVHRHPRQGVEPGR